MFKLNKIPKIIFLYLSLAIFSIIASIAIYIYGSNYTITTTISTIDNPIPSYSTNRLTEAVDELLNVELIGIENNKATFTITNLGTEESLVTNIFSYQKYNEETENYDEEKQSQLSDYIIIPANETYTYTLDLIIDEPGKYLITYKNCKFEFVVTEFTVCGQDKC